MRIALGIEYEGTTYHGWQAQTGLITVQSTVEAALSKIANEAITVTCAGRTDAGVHATGQVVHFDTEVTREHKAWIFGANTHLPASINVQWAKTVPADFHARYSALNRRYQYIIFNHNVRSSTYRHHATWYSRPLNEMLMTKAAAYLIGEHDFTSFRGADCQSRSAIRHVQRLTITRKDKFIIIDITANAFLHHMVRNIVGMLIKVGIEEQNPDWAQKLLLEKSKQAPRFTTPPTGLHLVAVNYPVEFNMQAIGHPLF